MLLLYRSLFRHMASLDWNNSFLLFFFPLPLCSSPLILNLNSCSLFCLVVGGTLFLDCFPHSRSISLSLSPSLSDRRSASHRHRLFCDRGRNRNGASIDDVRTELGRDSRNVPCLSTSVLQTMEMGLKKTLRASYMEAAMDGRSADCERRLNLIKTSKL